MFLNKIWSAVKKSLNIVANLYIDFMLWLMDELAQVPRMLFDELKKYYPFLRFLKRVAIKVLEENEKRYNLRKARQSSSTRYNPSTGLPMTGGGYDSSGNFYGSSSNDYYRR